MTLALIAVLLGCFGWQLPATPTAERPVARQKPLGRI
ncbi:Uncharacterised protein [Mycobacteroides abscessus subsp. abscessus]|nr:Uncharacterised protein [Mycobacteroides abscessus subsp. abscessus]